MTKIKLTKQMKKVYIQRFGFVKYIGYRIRRLLVGTPSTDLALSNVVRLERILKGLLD